MSSIRLNKKMVCLQQRNNYLLARKSLIRSGLAGFFLLLFAFGITPKRTLHNFVAEHSDIPSVTGLPDAGRTQVGTTGIYCQCDNLVSESPFVSVMQLPITLNLSRFISYQSCLVSYPYSSDLFCAYLRGPPAC